MPAIRYLRTGQNPPRLEIEGNWMPLGQPAVLTRQDLSNAGVQITKEAIEAYVNNVWLPSICAGHCNVRLSNVVVNGLNDIHWTLEVW